MTLSKSRPRAKRRWAVLVGAVMTGSLLLAGSVLAVHGEAFQLDGDASAATTTNINSTTQTVDWDSIFDSNGANKALPTGFTAARLDQDFQHTGTTFGTADTTTFSTGSKDTLPISGWQCNYDNNVNSKIDIMNAYAAAYTSPSGDSILYFGLERNTNTGDANVAFWFLQDNVTCATSGPSTTFSGAHKDGDLLIVSAFTKGGNVSTIDVYKWSIPDPSTDPVGFLDTVPVAHGVDCRDPLTAAGDTACAAANTVNNGTNGTIQVPWLTANFKDGVDHSLRTGEFFEGGLNLTKAELAGKCFNVFVGDTRSSQSLTATLFDYARGQLGECSASLETQTSKTTLQIGDAAPTDSATVKASATTSTPTAPTGDVSFYLCGPSTTLISVCDPSGLTAFDTKNLSGAVVSGNDYTVTSGAPTITSAGYYCFAARWPGDTTYTAGPYGDDGTNECFQVTPKHPSISTVATASGGVALGSSIDDTATLSGTSPKADASPAGGTITFNAYGPFTGTGICTGSPVYTSVVDVSGDGSYTASTGTGGTFTPTAAGTYNWIASYSGDPPNTASVSGSCGDANEASVILSLQPHISSTQSFIPNDTATVTVTSGAGSLAGSVTFNLYESNDCSGTSIYSQTVAVSGASPQVVSTTNTTVSTTSTVVSWKLSYASTNPGHKSISDTCLENSLITYNNGGSAP